MVGFEAVSYSTSESQGFVEISVIVTDPPSGAPRPFSLLLDTTDDTAGLCEVIGANVCQNYPLFSLTR